MDLAQLGQELAKIGLPLLGAALPIPGGAALGTALASVINSPSAKPDDILATMTANADSLQKAKEFELTHQEKILELTQSHELGMYQTEIQDRDGARKREVEVKDYTPTLLSIGITIGFFGILTFMLFNSPPAASRDILNIMLGSLGTAWVSVVAYYFGSSKGSDKATELLSKAPAIK